MNAETPTWDFQDHLPCVPPLAGDPRFADGVVMAAHLRQLAAAIAADGRISAVLHGETGTGKEMFARLVHKRRVEREGDVPAAIAAIESARPLREHRGARRS